MAKKNEKKKNNCKKCKYQKLRKRIVRLESGLKEQLQQLSDRNSALLRKLHNVENATDNANA